jgi:hypothetical protein
MTHLRRLRINAMLQKALAAKRFITSAWARKRRPRRGVKGWSVVSMPK